jgi:hypothetical protein
VIKKSSVHFIRPFALIGHVDFCRTNAVPNGGNNPELQKKERLGNSAMHRLSFDGISSALLLLSVRKKTVRCCFENAVLLFPGGGGGGRLFVYKELKNLRKAQKRNALNSNTVHNRNTIRPLKKNAALQRRV